MGKDIKNYRYTENALYSLANRIGRQILDDEDNASEKVKKAAPEIELLCYYNIQEVKDIRLRMWYRAWRYTILLNEADNFSPAVKKEIKEKVKEFVDSYDALFGTRKDDE